jgi:chromosome segregation ATPase
MRNLSTGLAAMAVLMALGAGVGHAADQDATARAREMLRRTQEALRDAQSANADLVRAKAETEQKLQAATKQIDAAKSGTKAAQATQASLQTQLQAAQSAQAGLERRYNDVNERLAASNSKLVDTSKQLAARDAELEVVKQGLEQSKTANLSCENKNIALYGYAEEVLKGYKNKGVWASLSQKEPVFGLKEVDVENVVQEYQLKFDSQRVKAAN